MAERRPFLLTLVGWLTVISGALQMIAGVLLLIFRDDVLQETSQYTEGELTGYAVAAVVVGAIYWLVGRGMLRLSGFALGLGLLVSALALAGNIAFLVSNDGDHGSIVAGLIINAVVFIACISGFKARSRRA